MNVRAVKIEDLSIQSLLDLGKQFFKEAGLPGTFRQEVFINNWATFITTGVGGMWVAIQDNGEVVGAIGGLLHPDPYGGDLVAQEMFWFIDPHQRGGLTAMRLYKQLETWAKDSGAKRIFMANVCNKYMGPLRALYEKLGYRPVDVSYTKEL